ncbi:MAG: hypothetical protein LBS95_01945 [Mycoplasmataceae bacterium]|jgi:hypothetical protein|nr:hypothetical protein [Mycoplasmataceae bacterium]
MKITRKDVKKILKNVEVKYNDFSIVNDNFEGVKKEKMDKNMKDLCIRLADK